RSFPINAMSTTPAPRRSTRERKNVPVVTPDDALTKGKRKRATSVDEDEDDEDDDPKPRRKTKQSAAAAKKPRKTARKVKEAQDAFDPDEAAKDSKINADNPLFNAILNPAAALQSTAEDFLESLDQSPELALAELVNLVMRACGCNETLSADQVADFDGIIDTLDDVTEELKKEQSLTAYPLTSRLPVFKKFRKSLHEFLDRLISSAASLGFLYKSEMIPTLQAWVIAMSSSNIRSFRHTATVVALELETALCEVAAAVEKEAELNARQREGEKKRRAGKAAATAQDKSALDSKSTEIRARRDKLKEFIKDFVDGVFIHRYRDLDPLIRADCTLALGEWFTKHPAHFLDAAYLRYIGWVLSDNATPVRLAALKALTGVYAQPTYAPQVHHFTERFKGRLLEMAARDAEPAVRVAVLGVLEQLGATALEDDEREQVALCVFDIEPKVRRAVGGFVRTCWEEALEERLIGHQGKVTDDEKAKAGVKAFGSVLVRWGRRLDADENGELDGSQAESDSGESRPGRISKAPGHLSGTSAEDRMGRAGIIVEALWDEVDVVRDWEAVLDVLLLDHSSAGDGSAPRKGKANGKSAASKRTDDSVIDEAWRLDEDEETVLLEVFVACLKYAKEFVKKGNEDAIANDITRELIKGLPRLIMKYQTDQNRIANVLTIPTLLNLDLYLEMRMITSYAALWDDMIKQFLSHSSPTVLNVAVQSLMYLMTATSLSNTNNTKILELEDELSSALHAAVGGRDEIEVATFDEDEVIALAALCARLSVLSGYRDLTGWMEEEEDGKQASALNIFHALVDRGRLGYKEEGFMITQALEVLTKHLLWKTKKLRPEDDMSEEAAAYREKLQEQRDMFLEKLVEYSVGTQSNTSEAVQRTAFMCLVNMYILFGERMSITLDDEVQFRCAGYVQAQVERYAETLDSDDAEKPRDVDPNSTSQLLTEYSFIELIVTFLRAIKTGVLHVRHTAILLPHYGRLGNTFDQFIKVIVDLLREDALEQDHSDVVVTVINKSLEEAFAMVLDEVVEDESNVLQLAKHLATTFTLRGAHLAVLKRMEVQYIVQIQTTALSWLAKRIEGYEANENKRGLKIATTCFRALVPLLSNIQSRDAMKIKAHLDQVLAEASVELSSTSKIWEPLRAYEKRLQAILNKEKVPGTKGRKVKLSRGDGLTSSEDETEMEQLVEEEAAARPKPRPRARKLSKKKKNSKNSDDDDEDGDAPAPKSKPQRRARRLADNNVASGADNEDDAEVDVVPTPPRTRPRRLSTKKTPVTEVDTDGVDDDDDEEEDEDENGEDEPAPPTPKARPRPRATYQSKAASPLPPQASSPAPSALSDVAAPSSANSKKRSRPDDADVEDEVPETLRGESEREATPMGDKQVRRKRARR
ncbi:unnamed protein product, partial [Mycena citricolor]